MLIFFKFLVKNFYISIWEIHGWDWFREYRFHRFRFGKWYLCNVQAHVSNEWLFDPSY